MVQMTGWPGQPGMILDVEASQVPDMLSQGLRIVEGSEIPTDQMGQYKGALIVRGAPDVQNILGLSGYLISGLWLILGLVVEGLLLQHPENIFFKKAKTAISSVPYEKFPLSAWGQGAIDKLARTGDAMNECVTEKLKKQGI